MKENIKYQTEALAQMLSRREVVLIDNDTEVRVVVDALASEQELGPRSVRELRIREKALRTQVNSDILESLAFEAQTERYEGVAEAHEHTFQWIFEKTLPEDANWDNFVDWLERGDGLYWINGKAGSGKSTLMKYICHHALTQKYLLAWAGRKRLCTSEFYFWNVGSRLQKSQIGLMRSLLCGILRQIPTLIPLVYPEIWAARYAARTSSEHLQVCQFEFILCNVGKHLSGFRLFSSLLLRCIVYLGNP